MTLPSDPIFDLTNPHAHAQDGPEASDEQIAAVDFKLDQEEVCKLDASCVRIVLVEPNLCPECGDETKRTTTHVVMLDLVNNGQDTGLMEGCLFCAEEFANDLRASLPAEKPE